VIFVTVGEQLSFERLVRTVDECAKELDQDVYAQIGETDWMPKTIKYKKFLNPDEFQQRFSDAEVIVAHAGMGTIITALELRKPIIVMPRQASLGEHRNDHQFATAKRFLKLDYITVAFDEIELRGKLESLAKGETFECGAVDIAPNPLLIKTIREFITKC
jgi:exopolysaccharide biosynthesis glucuronosyltransferase PssE